MAYVHEGDRGGSNKMREEARRRHRMTARVEAVGRAGRGAVGLEVREWWWWSSLNRRGCASGRRVALSDSQRAMDRGGGGLGRGTCANVVY